MHELDGLAFVPSAAMRGGRDELAGEDSEELLGSMDLPRGWREEVDGR